MSYWIRFEHDGQTGFGVLNGHSITVYQGDMYSAPEKTGEALALDAVKLLTPTEPASMIVMYNNSHAIVAKKNAPLPEYPLFFIKPANTFLPHGQAIVLPYQHSSRVVLEGELGIVIGKKCKHVAVTQAQDVIFGYTCVNDVTAQDIVEHPTLPQHVYSKAFDTFGVFGPVVATNVDPYALQVEAWLNGQQCQQFSVRDYIFGPYELVSYLSQIMTLSPGDIVSCGTSLGVAPLSAGDHVEIRIPGIGSLINSVV